MAVDGQRFMTKTQHYRKVTKPLLERKRRARMNLYLDELKDLIVDTMEAQGEHIAKLEKADILELTVNYLRSHKHEIAASVTQHQSIAPRSAGGGVLNVEKFRAGYTQAAYEVSRMFATIPGLDIKFGAKLMKHLGYQLKDLQQTLPSATPASPQRASSQCASPQRPSSQCASPQPASPASEQALNLEVSKRGALHPSPPPAAQPLNVAEQMRRAYQRQLHQEQQHALQQRIYAKMLGAKAMQQAEEDENGGECLWRPW